MADNILDKLAARAKVRVYKPFANSDDRQKLCGERVQRETINGEEKQFFEIPAHQGDYINRTFKHYIVTDPFIPGVDNPETLEIQAKPEVEAVGDEKK